MAARARHPWWHIYALSVAATVVAMMWLGSTLLRSQERESQALARTRHAETLRLALWQMDSWLAPLLAREAARPWYEYRSFYEAPEGSYTKLLNEIPAGSFLNRSPLLDFESDLVLLHCEFGADGVVTSPQVPDGNQLDLAEANGVAPGWVEQRQGTLRRLVPSLGRALEAGRRRDRENLEQLESAQDAAVYGRNDARQQGSSEEAKGARDLQQRASSTLPAQQQLDLGKRWSGPLSQTRGRVEVGPLIPSWPEDQPASEQELLWFLREVRGDGEPYQQGFAMDWPSLQAALLQRIAELLPEARLVPAGSLHAEATAADLDGRLASVPARLDAPLSASLVSGYLLQDRPGGALATLLATSLAVALAIVVVGLALRSSIRYGETRHRFASAVTHELRTPLTTFRMYSEMLAEGMVRGEEQRREYSRTLHREATRLSHLVENVLGFARLEEGRGLAHPLRLPLGGLLEKLEPGLQERCSEAGLEWSLDNRAGDELQLEVDVEALRQVLFNLVDNACKYAADGRPPRLQLSLERNAERLHLRLRDHGPGIAAAVRTRIFEHFHRGERAASDPTPGIGLGLALARGLAQELGGTLELESSDERGTCFLLSLPLAV